MLLYQELSNHVLKAFFHVHQVLGPGLLEAPYHNAMYYQLRKQGLFAAYQKPYSVLYEREVVGEYFADLVVENSLIVEIKSVSALNGAMKAQVLNYLNISGLAVGYLVNFRNPVLEWKRLINFHAVPEGP